LPHHHDRAAQQDGDREDQALIAPKESHGVSFTTKFPASQYDYSIKENPKSLSVFYAASKHNFSRAKPVFFATVAAEFPIDWPTQPTRFRRVGILLPPVANQADG